MSNFYKPRYKIVFRTNTKCLPYKNSRLSKFVDTRGKRLVRKGYWHRRQLKLKNLKWFLIRYRFGLNKFKQKLRIKKKNKYKQNILNIKRIQLFYGKFDYTNFKKLVWRYYNNWKTNKIQNLIYHLEQRLDVLAFRLKYLPTILAAHNFIKYKGIFVNNQLIRHPYEVANTGDIICFDNTNWNIFFFIIQKKIYLRIIKHFSWSKRLIKIFKKIQLKKFVNKKVWKKYTIFKKNGLLKINKWFRKHDKYLSKKVFLRKKNWILYYNKFYWFKKKPKKKQEDKNRKKPKRTYRQLKKFLKTSVKSSIKFKKNKFLERYELNKINSIFKKNYRTSLNQSLKFKLNTKRNFYNNWIKKKMKIQFFKKNFIINKIKKNFLTFKIKKIKLINNLIFLKKWLNKIKTILPLIKNKSIYWLYFNILIKYKQLKNKFLNKKIIVNNFFIKEILTKKLIFFIYNFFNKKLLKTSNDTLFNNWINKILNNKNFIIKLLNKLKSFYLYKTKSIKKKVTFFYNYKLIKNFKSSINFNLIIYNLHKLILLYKNNSNNLKIETIKSFNKIKNTYSNINNNIYYPYNYVKYVFYKFLNENLWNKKRRTILSLKNYHVLFLSNNNKKNNNKIINLNKTLFFDPTSEYHKIEKHIPFLESKTLKKSRKINSLSISNKFKKNKKIKQSVRKYFKKFKNIFIKKRFYHMRKIHMNSQYNLFQKLYFLNKPKYSIKFRNLKINKFYNTYNINLFKNFKEYYFKKINNNEPFKIIKHSFKLKKNITHKLNNIHYYFKFINNYFNIKNQLFIFNYLVQYLNLNLLFYYQLEQLKIFIKKMWLFFKNKSLKNKNVFMMLKNFLYKNYDFSFLEPFLNKNNINNIKRNILWNVCFEITHEFKKDYRKKLFNIFNIIEKNKIFNLRLFSVYNLKKFSKRFLIKYRIYNIMRRKNFKSFLPHKLKFYKDKLFEKKIKFFRDKYNLIPIQKKVNIINNKIDIYEKKFENLDKKKIDFSSRQRIKNLLRAKSYYHKMFLKKLKKESLERKDNRRNRRYKKRKKYLFNKILNSNKKLKKKNKLYNKNLNNSWYIPNYIEYDYKTLRGGLIRKPFINELVYTFNYSLKDLINYYKNKGF